MGTIPQRLGMPKLNDVAAQYRLHADRIANGETMRPTRSVLVEFDESGYRLFTFGMPDSHIRELVSIGADAIAVLAETVQVANAKASN